MTELKYDEEGLVPVICQDANTLEVLMLAYAKREQIMKTISTKRATYYSRSRKSEWIKGETSGNTQEVINVMVDCDLDAVIYLVKPAGPACHTNHRSCFYRSININGELEENE